MRVICVDDERPALENFRLTAEAISEISSLELFQSGNKALEWVKENKTDVAFLDMEMPGLHGLELARKLREIDPNICVIFVTAYRQYALEAFGVDATGYLLKPYTCQEIQKELEKVARIRPKPLKNVCIRTIPDFSIVVDGKVLYLGRTKPEELLALLVDRGNAGLTSGEAISCLWPGRPSDEKTQSLYRVTFHRLMEVLKEAGIDHIICTEGRRKYILTDQVDCDLYRILDGDVQMLRNYGGEYMREYFWAEVRNAQLNSMKNA